MRVLVSGWNGISTKQDTVSRTNTLKSFQMFKNENFYYW